MAGARILLDRPGRRLQLRLDFGAARAQAGGIAQLGGQGFEDGRVDADAEAPAGAVGGSRVGEGAVVGGTAGRAEVRRVHRQSEAFPRRFDYGRFAWPGTSHDPPETAGCARCHRAAGWSGRC